MKTALIDGTNLSIIHFTANPAVDKNGVPMGMVKGFVNSILWILKTLKPDRIYIFFDGDNSSKQRKQIYSEYKQNRKTKKIVGRFFQFSDEDKAEKNRQYQFSVLREILDFLPVEVVICNHFEVDDAISYCVKYKEYFNFTYINIVSCDKDFIQLISDDVSIYNPMSKKIINTKSVIADYGIHPHNWLLYRSITGDSSDNLDGIRGIGPKTALKIFSLESDVAFDLEDVKELISVAVEQPSSINKNILSNLLKIKEDFAKIERNWKLMDLKNPIIDNFHSKFLDDCMKSSSFSFEKLKFWKKCSEHSLGLDLGAFDEFKSLIKENK
jgi:DNA polymerase-1